MGCCSVGSTNAEVQLRVRGNLLKNPGDAGGSPAILSLRHSLAFLPVRQTNTTN